MWVRERFQWDQGAARWYKVSHATAPSVAVTPEAPGGVAADPPWLPAGTSQGIDPWVAAAKNPPYRCATTYQWRYQVKLDGTPLHPVFVRESWRVAVSWHGGEWENPGGDTGALPDFASPGNASPFGGPAPKQVGESSMGLAMPLALGFALWKFLK